MPRSSLQPAELFASAPFGFAQVVYSQGDRYIHCSGQTAWTKDGALVGGDDLGAQLEAALDNVRTALAEVGATPKDLVRVTIYVVDYQPEQVEVVTNAMSAFFDAEHLPACTLVGVQALAMPDFLVEVEATAILDE